MPKIIINKKDASVAEKQSLAYIKVDFSELKNIIENKLNTNISELTIEKNNLIDGKELTTEETISELLIKYDEVKSLMTEQELINFFETIKFDLPRSYFQNDKIKTKALSLDVSQGILVLNDFNEIKGYKYPNLGNDSFNSPKTITTWIKPNTINYRNRTLFRHMLTLQRRITLNKR